MPQTDNNANNNAENQQLKIAITGITGKMGRNIYQCLAETSDIKLTCVTLRQGHDFIGKTLAQAGFINISNTISNTAPDSNSYSNSNVIISETLHTDFDVLIDFTSVDNTLANLEFCKANNKAIVIGTTGFSDADIAIITEFSKSIPVLISANMSLGVNVMQYLCEIATKALADKADIEIVETHHKHKVDAPSGTAMMLGKTIAKAANLDLTNDGVFSRHGIIGARPENTIGFAAIRGGDVIGEHTVHYFLAGERLEITHKASDRKVFARGALFAAKFLAKQQTKHKVGLYNMNDALQL